jgi:hypothetical protein
MTKLVEKDALHIVEEDNIRPPPPYHSEGPPQILTSDTARQGPRGLPVLIVLTASMLLAGIVWAVVAELVY